MSDDNPLWYDCDEEGPHKRDSSRIALGARVMVVFILFVAAYLAYRFLF